MRPSRAASLLLLLLGLARATTPGTDGPTTPGTDGPTRPGTDGITTPGLGDVAYGDVVSAAVELLNARAVSPYVLRLREAQPRPSWTGDLRRRQELSFTVEETTCRAPGTSTAACKSRWLGGVTWCRGWVFLEQQQPTVELSCERVPATLGRIRTSRLTDIFTRIKERLRGFFQCTKIWIRDKLNLKKPQM